MERAPLEAKARLSSAKLSEVLRGLGDHVGPQLEGDPAQLLAPGAQVEVDSGQSGLGGEMTGAGRTPGPVSS